jgi:hypothetical protein
MVKAEGGLASKKSQPTIQVRVAQDSDSDIEIISVGEYNKSLETEPQKPIL